MIPHTFVLVPLGLALLMFSRTWLYRLMIASTLFSGTAVYNVGSGANASGVQVWMFFGGLWLLRDLVSRLAHGNISLRRGLIPPVTWLASFIFVLTLSLIMPIYINGRLQVASPVLTDTSFTPLFFTTRNITSWLYMVFGSLLAVSIANENRTVGDLTRTGRIYLWSGVFVAMWAFLQIFCGATSIPYPAFLFNNSASPGALGYASTLSDLGVQRISSVALEPSVLSEILLTIIPLTIPALLNCGYLISRRIDRPIFVLLALALFATMSTAAFLSFMLLLLATLVLSVRMRIKKGRAVVKLAAWILIGVPGSFALLYAAVPLFRGIANLVLFSKAGSYSALERFKTVHDASGYFVKYPILGIGWGSVTSYDLLFKLLSNVGVVGALCFTGMVLWIGWRLYSGVRAQHDRIALTKMVWLLALGMLIFTSAIGGFGYVLGHTWLTLGIAMSAAVLSEDLTTKSSMVLHSPAASKPSGA